MLDHQLQRQKVSTAGVVFAGGQPDPATVLNLG
jgi:hypothetical protein